MCLPIDLDGALDSWGMHIVGLQGWESMRLSRTRNAWYEELPSNPTLQAPVPQPQTVNQKPKILNYNYSPPDLLLLL